MDQTRTRLLDAAGHVFAEKGFDGASIREVCQRADANVAAVNYYFGDKKRLYIAAVREAQCCETDQIPAPAWPPGTPAVQRLRDFIHHMLATKLDVERPRWHLELMLREMTRPTEACAEVVRDYIRPMADVLRDILKELMPGQERDLRGWMIGNSIVGQILLYYVHRPIVRDLMGPEQFDQLTTDQLTDHIAHFTLAAMGLETPLRAIPSKSSTTEVSP